MTETVAERSQPQSLWGGVWEGRAKENAGQGLGLTGSKPGSHTSGVDVGCSLPGAGWVFESFHPHTSPVRHSYFSHLTNEDTELPKSQF